MLKRRSPLKAKREKPRRNEGRVTHKRIKPKTTGKTAEEARYIEHVAGLGCLICGKPATVHHVTSDGFKRIARSHKLVVPLCPVHHLIQWGPKESVEALGHAGFKDRYGVDLYERARELWRKNNA